MLQAFTLGRIPALGLGSGCVTAGGVHANAIGYATVDVVSSCNTLLPSDEGYFGGAILFDNVLMGDYQQVDGSQNYAQGNPMVHIRAIPEGGSAAQRASGDENYRVNFKRTFYSRYQPAATMTFDARQPLPARFAVRWISGGATGYLTYYKIWREGRTGRGASCKNHQREGELDFVEMVRFDEDENPQSHVNECFTLCYPPTYPLPPTSSTDISDGSVFPPNPSGDVSGWLYLNLQHDTDAPPEFATQNWVVVSMRADGRYSVDFDALALGNGCTPPMARSQAYESGGPVIGPSPNVNP